MRKVFARIASNAWLQLAAFSVPVWVTLIKDWIGIVFWFGLFVYWVITFENSKTESK